MTGVFLGNPGKGVDVLIVGRVAKDKIKTVIRKLEKDLDKEINFTVMDMNEFKYRREIADVFLYDILEGDKIVVIDELGLN